MRDFQSPGRSLVYATNGMAATSHPLATQVAVAALQAGGNAVDAALSAALVLNVCEPHMTGLGGDCFVLVKPAGTEDVIGLNGSGRAPAATDADALRAKGDVIDPRSADAVTVPGAVDAFVTLAADHGTWGLDRITAPGIAYAETGIPVAPRVASDWAENVGALQGIAREHYLIDGAAPRTGQIFRAPGQATVLRAIAAQGRAGFYEGAVAADMLGALGALGGCHTQADFDATRAEYVTPIRGTYANAELIEMPPNGQGAVAILLLNILAQFDLAALDPLSPARIHLEAEATKLAYDARNRFIGDPAASARYLDRMLDMKTARDLAALIDPARAMTGPAALSESVHTDTVYLTVVDKDRMAVSLIYSIFNDFGSGIAAPQSGILLQNRGAGFTLAPGHPNEAGPGKRPMHTIIPAMLARRGKIEMPFGVMGGQYQATGHARFVSNIETYGLDPQAAMDMPRTFATDGTLQAETSLPQATRDALTAMGHVVTAPETAIGGSQSISIDGDVLVGASDPRKDGCALGY